jgi:cell division protein FtsW (lipid II flippase)
MINDVFYLAYLLRYVFVILFALLVWQLTGSALKTLRRDLRYRIKPVRGFLLRSFQNGNGAFSGQSFELETDDGSAGFSELPLYHTTYIGRSAACDIRIRNKTLAKRHAMLYRYDGDWFIKPVSGKNPVALNGVRIVPATPLEHGDIVSFGDVRFRFIDERQETGSARLIHNNHVDTGTEAANPEGRAVFTWILTNLFVLFSALLIIKLIPQGLDAVTYSVSMYYIIIAALFNLYYFLLPLILSGIDRSLILITYLLTSIGIMFQIRLSGILSSNVLAKAAALPEGTVSAELAELAQLILADLKPQGIAFLLGLVLMPFVALVTARTRLLEPLTLLCAIVTPALLIVTLIFGRGSETHGASLWISFGGTSIQLTEFAKITYLIVLAGFFKIRPAKTVQLFFAVWAGAVFLLVLLLPDLGMAMILLPTTLIIYLVMTSEYLTTLLIMLSGTALGAFALTVFPHVQRRFAGWSTLWQEVNDSNRQIVYGLQAVARGGIFGRGLGNGSPAGLPLASSDMVYAIICEESGLIAGIAIISIFIVFWLRSARITVVAGDGFSSSLALAIGTMFFVEAAVVIAGVTGLIPLTGVTLPLIAEGGSSVLSKLILISILLGLSARRDRGTR